jgi:glycosyltransferase involved in cell wall biosynthesis
MAFHAEKEPLVTAVMVTGRDSQRLAFARLAAACFDRQTYLNRELLIINTAIESLRPTIPNAREIHLPRARCTLGELRNIGIESISGGWVIQWDDDDWHHPERIQAQMEARRSDGACLLGSQLRLSTVLSSAYVCSNTAGIHGTILHAAKIPWRYPALARAEDTRFLECFPRIVALENPARLYVRIYHGANTWPERHIMADLTGKRNELPHAYRELCREILDKYKSLSVVSR